MIYNTVNNARNIDPYVLSKLVSRKNQINLGAGSLLDSGNYTSGITEPELNALAIKTAVEVGNVRNAEILQEKFGWPEWDEVSNLNDTDSPFRSGKIMSKYIGMIEPAGKEIKETLSDGTTVSRFAKTATIIDDAGRKVETGNPQLLRAKASAAAVLENTNQRSEGFFEDAWNTIGAGLIGNNSGAKKLQQYYYPAFDSESGEWYLQGIVGTLSEIEKLQRTGINVVNQYGTKPYSSNVIAAAFRSTGNGFLDLTQTWQDAISGLSNIFSGLDGDYTEQNANADYERFLHDNQYRRTIASSRSQAGLFSNPEAFASGLGQGFGSLMQYALTGGAARAATGAFFKAAEAVGIASKTGGVAAEAAGLWSKTGKYLKGLVDNPENLAMMSAGTLINSGEAYTAAIQAGLSRDDAALLAPFTGVLAAMVEVGVGTNMMQRWLIGGRGKEKLAREIVEEVGGNLSKLDDAAVVQGIVNRTIAKIQKGAPVLAGGLEEMSEEIIQGGIKATNEWLYDSIFSRTKEEGRGYFGTNPFSPKSLMSYIEEGTIGFILGAGGGVLASRSRNKTSVLREVAAGREKEAKDAIDMAFNQNALTEDQANAAKADIDNYVKIRDTHTDLLGEVNRFKKEYRPLITEMIIKKLDEQQAFIEDNKDIQKFASSQNSDERGKYEDYLNELKAMLFNSFTMAMPLPKGQTASSPSFEYLPFDTAEAFISQLEEGGKKTEAQILRLAISDATSKVEKSGMNSDWLKNATTEELLAYRRLKDERAKKLSIWNVNQSINNKRLEALKAAKNRIVSDSNQLSTREEFLRVQRIFDDEINAFSRFLEQKLTSINDHVDDAERDRVIEEIYEEYDRRFEDVDKFANENGGAAQNIGEFVEILYNEGAISIDQRITKLAISTSLSKSYSDDIANMVKNQKAIEAANKANGTNVGATLNPDGTIKPEEEPKPIEPSTAYKKSEIAKLIDDHKEGSIEVAGYTAQPKSTPQTTPSGMSESCGYLITKPDGSVINRPFGFATKEVAYESMKATLKAEMLNDDSIIDDENPEKPMPIDNKKVDIEPTDTEEVKPTEELEKQEIESGDFTEIPLSPDGSEMIDEFSVAGGELDLSGESVQHEERTPAKKEKPTDLKTPFDEKTITGDNFMDEAIKGLINNPNTSNGVFQGGSFGVSDNWGEIEKNKSERAKAVHLFNKLKSVADFEKLTNEEQTHIIKYLPIRYIFGGKIVYLFDNTAGALSEKAFKQRKAIILAIANSSRKIATMKGEVGRTSGYLNSGKTNNRLTDVNSLKPIIGENGEKAVIVVSSPSSKSGAPYMNDGAIYLEIPGESLINNERRLARLNPTKTSPELASLIADIYYDIANEKISIKHKIPADNKYGIVTDGKMTYEEFFKYVMFANKRLEGKRKTRENLERQLNLSLIDGAILYGFNPETNKAYVLNALSGNPTYRQDRDVFVEWMTKTKNMPVNASMLGKQNKHSFEAAGLKMVAGESYEQWVINNGIVKTDLMKNGQLLKNVKLTFEPTFASEKPISGSSSIDAAPGKSAEQKKETGPREKSQVSKESAPDVTFSPEEKNIIIETGWRNVDYEFSNNASESGMRFPGGKFVPFSFTETLLHEEERESINKYKSFIERAKGEWMFKRGSENSLGGASDIVEVSFDSIFFSHLKALKRHLKEGTQEKLTIETNNNNGTEEKQRTGTGLENNDARTEGSVYTRVQREEKDASERESVEDRPAEIDDLLNPTRRTIDSEDNVIEPIDEELLGEEDPFEGDGKRKTKRRIGYKKNGINYAVFTNENGVDSVVIAGIGENDFIAYKRVFDKNGQPTDRFTSKMEIRNPKKGMTAAMLTELEKRMPENYIFTEDKNISLDGLKFWFAQKKHGYEYARDEKGNIITQNIPLSSASNTNELPVDIGTGNEFEAIVLQSREDFDKVKEYLRPLFEENGIPADKITSVNGKIVIPLPELKKVSKKTEQQSQSSQQSQEAKQHPEIKTNGENVSNDDIAEYAKKMLERLQKDDSFNDDGGLYDQFMEVENPAILKDNYKKGDQSKELKNYRRMFKFGGRVRVVDNLIRMSTVGEEAPVKDIVDILGLSGNPRYAWASMNEDGVALYSGAIEGALYHESFHRVSLLYLSKTERAAIYDRASREFGIDRNDEFAIEEALAEKFRDFVLQKESKYEILPTDNIIQKFFKSLKRFLNLFLNKYAYSKPNLASLEGLFNSIYHSGFRYRKPNQEAVNAFKRRYNSADVGMEVEGVNLNQIHSYNTLNKVTVALTALTLNTNGVDVVADLKNKINYAKPREVVKRLLIHTYGQLADSALENDERKALLNKAMVYQEIYDNFGKVFVPAINRKLNYLGLKSKTMDDIMSEREELDFFDGIKNDEISSSYEYSSKDTASINIRLLFQTLLSQDKADLDPETFLPKYEDFDTAWFNVMKLVHDAGSYQEMLNRLHEASLEITRMRQEKNPTITSYDNVNIYSSLLDKLNSSSSALQNQFWVSFKKHRHDFQNTYYSQKRTGKRTSYTYGVSSADSADNASNKLTNEWSTSAHRRGIFKKENREALNAARSKWKNLYKLAYYNKFNVDFESTVSDLVDIFNAIGIGVDRGTVIRAIDSFNQAEPLAKLRAFILSSKYSANETINDYVKEIYGQESIFKYGRTIYSPNFLKSQKLVQALARDKVSQRLSRKTDSIAGPSGNTVYAYSEYSYLTQVVEEFLKTNEMIDALASEEINLSSLWLAQLLDEKVRKGLSITTPLSMIKNDSSDTGRGYLEISQAEDTLMKMNLINNGQYPVPVLANKRTYHAISGLKMYDAEIRINKTNGTIKLAPGVIDDFYNYFKSEVGAIEAALDARSKFLKDNNLTLDEFNNLSEFEQEMLDYSDLVENYHYKIEKYTVNGNSFSRINLREGNGYQYRYFKNIGRAINAAYIYGENPNSEGSREYQTWEDGRVKEIQKAKDLIRKQLTGRINLTIESLAKQGIIGLDKELQSTNESIGTANEGPTRRPVVSNLLMDSAVLGKIEKDFSEQYEEDASSIAAIKNIVNYAINTAISTIEFDKIVHGDLAFFKDNEDRIKRYSALASTGALLSRRKGSYKAMIIKSNVIKSQQVMDDLFDAYIGTSESPGELVKLYKRFRSQATDKQYAKFKDKTDEQLEAMAKESAKSRLKGYLSTDQTDGQVLMHPRFFKLINESIGEWSDEREAAYQLLISDKELTKEEEIQAYTQVIMQPLKLMYFAKSFENGLGIPTYDKPAYFPIFKRLAKGRDLEVIFDMMESNGTDTLQFQSATKAGNRQGFRAYSEGGELRKEFIKSLEDKSTSDRFMQERKLKFLRRQLVTDPHDVSRIMLGTQASKIGISGIEDGSVYSVDGNDMTGKELKKEYVDTVNELTRRGYGRLSDELGFDLREDGSIKINREAFLGYLRRESIKTEMPLNLTQSLSVDKDGNYIVHPSVMPSIDWIQSKMLSKFKKRVIDINTPGNALIQVSNFGWKQSDIKVKKASYAENKELAFRDPRNRQEAIVSISLFKDILPSLVESDGTRRAMTFEEAKQFILEHDIAIMGYRIPTQGKNSIVPIHVVDFLPETSGDTIILPAEFTTLTGSDFDIDKLYVARYNYEQAPDDKRQMRKVPFNNTENKWQDNSTEAIENRLIDLYMSVLTSNEHILETSTPLDATTKPLKDAVKTLSSVTGEDTISDLEALFPDYQSRTKGQNTGADAGIGPMALANVHQALTELVGLEFNPRKSNVVSALGLTSLHRKYDKDGVLIQDWLSAMINAHVDAAKDPYILKLNINKYTYSAVAMMLRTGAGESALYFMPQPILKEIADEYINTFTGDIGVDPYVKKSGEWKRAIRQRYLEKSSGVIVSFNDIKDKVLDKNWLLSQATTSERDKAPEWYATQLAILGVFDEINKMGMALSDLVSASQIDTAKYGKNASDLVIFQEMVSVARDNELFINPENVFDMTALREKYDKSVLAIFRAFEGELLEFTPGVQGVIRRLAASLGFNRMSNSPEIKAISNELKSIITSDFFNQWADFMGYDKKELLYGETSVVNELDKIIRKIEKDDNLVHLRENILLKLLAPNTTSTQQSIDNKIPMFFDVSTSKEMDASSMNDYTAAWRELLLSHDDDVTMFAEKLILYAYMTSGGIGAGMNNIFNLVPFDILGNLEVENGVTYNKYMIDKIADNQHSRAQIINRDVLMRSLWANDSIVPSIGTFTKDGGAVFSSYVIAEQRTKNNATSGLPLNLVINPKNAASLPIYIKLKSDTGNIQDSIMYKYIGDIVSENEDPKPVYQLVNKLGYRQGSFILKEGLNNGYSIIPGNNVNKIKKDLPVEQTIGGSIMNKQIERFEPIEASFSDMAANELAPTNENGAQDASVSSIEALGGAFSGQADNSAAQEKITSPRANSLNIYAGTGERPLSEDFSDRARAREMQRHLLTDEIFDEYKEKLKGKMWDIDNLESFRDVYENLDDKGQLLMIENLMKC